MYLSAEIIRIGFYGLSIPPAASDLGIEVAVGAETPAERDVDVYHPLSEQQFGAAETGLYRIGLDGVDTLAEAGDVVDVYAHLHLVALVVNLA